MKNLYRNIHLKDGRDADLKILKARFSNTPCVSDEVFNAGRVGRVAYLISALSEKQVLGVHDYKGCLTVVWGELPDFPALELANKAWDSECECMITHIYFCKNSCTFRPIVIELNSVDTPRNFEETIGDLGLEGYPLAWITEKCKDK